LPQQYPKDGGEPYDDVSWELPAHYHVQASSERRCLRSAIVRSCQSDRAASRERRVTGSGAYYVLKDTGQEGFLEARYRLAHVQRRDRRARVRP
jgi:hypothetical protein